MENLPTTHDAVSAPYTGPHRANPTTRVPFATPEPTCAHRRNSRKCYGSELRPPPAPLPPNVAGEVLNGDEISFLDFITDERFRGYLQLLLGSEGDAAGRLVVEFRKAQYFHYFGVQAGKLTETKAARKKLLKQFARRAYRGDPDRRGVLFWERVAWLVWDAYAKLIDLRRRAEKIISQERARLASLSGKRASRAKYMRGYRAIRNAKAAVQFTAAAKEKWRPRRSH